MKLLALFFLLAASVFAQVHKNTLTATCSGTCQTQQDGISAINFYRSAVSGSGYTKIGTVSVVPVTGTPIIATFIDSNVVAGNTFYYVATVINPGGESSYSVQSQPCTTPFQAPTTPPTVSATVN